MTDPIKGAEGRPEPAPEPLTPGSENLNETATADADWSQISNRRLRDLDKELETELEAAMGGLTAEDLYGTPASAAEPAPEVGHEKKKGRVVAVRGSDIFVNVPGERSQGVLPSNQFGDGPPKPGTEVEFTVEGYDEENGLLVLSRHGAAVHADWSSVAHGMIVEARVTGTNKGGLAVDVNGIRGFMPISQIDLYRVENPEQFVNQRLTCVVTEANAEERNLVVSRRALLEKEREENREKLWQELAEGQIRDGVVRSVRDFGAFVDLGGVDGLLHVSEMAWTRVKNPAEVVQPGQTIKVIVLKLDRDHRKVGLGLKQLTASPWDGVEQKYPANTVVSGKVTRLMDFGAFVELEPGMEGLIHVSELAPQRVHRVADIVQPDQIVQVVVLRVDAAARKISLSLKQALSRAAEQPESGPEEPEEETAPRPQRPRTTPLRGGLGG